MAKCHECGDDVSMPYQCDRCKNKYCSKHRLPEKHTCPGLNRTSPNTVYVEKKSSGKSKKKDKIKDKMPSPKIIPNEYMKKIDGNLTWIFAGIFVMVYILQLLVHGIFGANAHNSLFVLQGTNLEYVWTWVTSIFSHSIERPIHIIGNGIILVFFGSLLEKTIGTREYFKLFIVAGILAGLGQVLLGIVLGNPHVGVLGASGALLAVMGVLTVYKPDMSVYLYFIIPIPLWLITGGYVVLSVVGIFGAAGFMANVAHVAHLVGLIIGLIYGYKTQDKYNLTGGFNVKRQMPRK